MKIERSCTVRALCAALAVMNLAWPLSAHAAEVPKKECTVAENKKDLATKSSNLVVAVVKVYSARCSTYENMKLRLTASRIDAGRKLEKTPELNVNAAQAQLKIARANPEFQAGLASELEGVTDETTKALLEIALLDDMEYDKARELLLAELRKGGAK